MRGCVLSEQRSGSQDVSMCTLPHHLLLWQGVSEKVKPFKISDERTELANTWQFVKRLETPQGTMREEGVASSR